MNLQLPNPNLKIEPNLRLEQYRGCHKKLETLYNLEVKQIHYQRLSPKKNRKFTDHFMTDNKYSLPLSP